LLVPADASSAVSAAVGSGREAGVLVVVVVTLLVRVTWLVLPLLLAMRVFAWAGRMGPKEPTATRMSRMLQASATHADIVRTRMVPSLSFRGNKR
jgi:hypothetical protein